MKTIFLKKKEKENIELNAVFHAADRLGAL